MRNIVLATSICIGVLGVGFASTFAWYKLKLSIEQSIEQVEKPNPEVNIYESKEVFFMSCIKVHSNFQCAAYAESYFRGREG